LGAFERAAAGCTTAPATAPVATLEIDKMPTLEPVRRKLDKSTYKRGMFMTHDGGAAMPCDGLSPAAAAKAGAADNTAAPTSSFFRERAEKLDQAIVHAQELARLVKQAKARQRSEEFWRRFWDTAYV